MTENRPWGVGARLHHQLATHDPSFSADSQAGIMRRNNATASPVSGLQPFALYL